MFAWRSYRTLLIVACIATCLMPLSTAAQMRDPETRAADVEEAIGRGVAFLYKQRDPQKHWEPVAFADRNGEKHSDKGGQWGGMTSLVSYALLAAGESPDRRPELRAAVDDLAKVEIEGVYALGMRAQVWLNLPQRPQYRQAMARDYETLLEAVQGNSPQRRNRRDVPNRGLFDYLPKETDRIDMSVSQYGVLGIWAAAEYGAEVPPAYWEEMAQGWLRWQLPDGEWAYGGKPGGNHPSSLGMALAGAASLLISQDYLRTDGGCNGNVTNPPIEKALDYISQKLPYLVDLKTSNDEKLNRVANVSKWRYYTLYGVERVGVASGRKYLGDVDWYAAGSDWLLKKQKSDGSWGSEQDTAFALLFLANGRHPVAINKLAWSDAEGEAGIWNQRPRDVSNLLKYVRRSDERDVSWQSIDLAATLAGSDGEAAMAEAVREMHEAPLAWLAGSRAFNPSESQVALLKEYLLTGGTLLVNADCSDRRFAGQVTKVFEDAFADEGYKFRPLPDSHVLLSDQKFTTRQMRRKPRLFALGNGVREFVILAQGDDLGRTWQTGAGGIGESAFQVGVNLYLYAVGGEQQRGKGVTHLVAHNSAVTPEQTVRVGRVKHAGNWNPEPAGWTRLANVLHNEQKIAVELVEADPADGAGALADLDLLHLTGVGEAKLSEKAVAAMVEYVRGGGTLLVDAAGGDGAFAKSIEATLQQAFGADGEALSRPLPVTHPLYKTYADGLDGVRYRLHAMKTLGSERTPRLRGLEIDGRLAVIYSPEDLSAGLVGNDVGGIFGYSPDFATRLTAAVVRLSVADRGE
jgi:hypothetical protein